MIPSQMLKGTLEGCILKVISERETYGYEILQRLRDHGFSQITEGTLYPLLLRLEKNGFVTVRYRDSDLGPQRKYFSLTAAGEAELRSFSVSWEELTRVVWRLFQKEGNGHG